MVQPLNTCLKKKLGKKTWRVQRNIGDVNSLEPTKAHAQIYACMPHTHTQKRKHIALSN